MGAARGPPCVVDQALDDGGRDAGPRVLNRDQLLVDGDYDDRRFTLFLGGVDGVVDNLLEDDRRPVLERVPDLFGQLGSRGELGEA